MHKPSAFYKYRIWREYTSIQCYTQTLIFRGLLRGCSPVEEPHKLLTSQVCGALQSLASSPENKSSSL